MGQNSRLSYPSRKSQRDDAECSIAGCDSSTPIHSSDSWVVLPNVRQIPLHHLRPFHPSVSSSSINLAESEFPYPLHPGETAIFVFQTEEDCISDQQFTELLKVVNVKVFIVTMTTEGPEISRVRLDTDEDGGKLDEEVDLFGTVEAANPTTIPYFPSENQASSTGQLTSECIISSSHSLSSTKVVSTPSGSGSSGSQCFQSSLLSSSKLHHNVSLKKKFEEAFHFSLHEKEKIFSHTTMENFWTPPTMVLWRCGLSPPSHYSTSFYYEPDFPQELPERLKEEAFKYGSILALKSLSSPNILPCYASFPCAYTPAHLHYMTVSPTCKGGAEGFTVLMVSASDCPPCRKVFSQAKTLWDSLPVNTSLYKVDWYLAKELRECFEVDLIPFFILIKNTEILRCPNPISCHLNSSSQLSLSGQRWTPVDTLQQSDIDRIIFFIEQYTKPLSFTDDF